MRVQLRRKGILSVLVVVTAAVVVIAGCFESSTEVAETESGVALSMSQIRAEVSMSDNQASVVAAALARWNTDSDEPPGPAMRFLASSARALDREQIKALIGVVARSPMENGRRGRRGRHGGGERMDLFADLGLTDAQREQIEAAHQAMRDAGRALRELLVAGDITTDEARTERERLHEEFKTALAGILTEDQLATLEAARSERLIEHLTRQIERLESGESPRLDALATILGLSDEQVAAIAGINADTIAPLKDVLTGLEDDSLDMESARAALKTIHEEKTTAVKEVLTDEQVAMLDELGKLRHRRHGGFGPE